MQNIREHEIQEEIKSVKEKLKQLKHSFVDEKISITTYKEEEERLAEKLEELEEAQEAMKREAEQNIRRDEENEEDGEDEEDETGNGVEENEDEEIKPEHNKIEHEHIKRKKQQPIHATHGKKRVHTHTGKENKENVHAKTPVIWYVVAAVLTLLLLLSIITGGFGVRKTSAEANTGAAITKQEASLKAMNYINTLLESQNIKAEELSIEDTGILYKLKVSVGLQTYDAYITKDGKLLFLSAFDLTEEQVLPQAQQQNQAGAGASARVQVSIDDDPSIGPSNASITIIEFSDYQCPFCARAEPTIKQVLEKYKDKVLFVYRDFPLSFHQYAQKAAEASECADEQGKFWQYHDKLFENQGALDADSLKKYAKDLGLDTTKFNACLDSGKMAAEVNADFADGQNAGVSGTPAFYINGIELSGAQPFSEFQKIIDKELSK